MRLLLNASIAFAVAALWTGTGPFAAPRWQAVAAELAQARPQERLAAQARTLLHPGLPHRDAP
jgi:hypothetical protein